MIKYSKFSRLCGVFSAIHEQSPDINRGVEREDPMNQGAGDQGMMFGLILIVYWRKKNGGGRIYY